MKEPLPKSLPREGGTSNPTWELGTVDGEIHFSDEAQEHYDGRTGELEKFGIKVMRFTNNQVIQNQDYIIKQIHEHITALSSPALPGAGDRRG